MRLEVRHLPWHPVPWAIALGAAFALSRCAHVVRDETRPVAFAEADCNVAGVAAEDHRLEVLTPSGLTDQEKQMARFYSAGQVLKFTRDNPGLGIARDADYRVVGVGRNNHGRQVVRLAGVARCGG